MGGSRKNSGGQFTPFLGGQFKSADGGQFESANGGQFDRHFHNLPASIDNLLKEDIIGLNRKSKIEILSQKYVNYTIINLLEL